MSQIGLVEAELWSKTGLFPYVLHMCVGNFFAYLHSSLRQAILTFKNNCLGSLVK